MKSKGWAVDDGIYDGDRVIGSPRLNHDHGYRRLRVYLDDMGGMNA